MSFIVAVLLLHMTEEQAFWSFTSLMKGTQLTATAMIPSAPAPAAPPSALRDMFIEGMPLLQLSLFQWQGLIESELPKLASHLRVHGMDASLFATHWFNTLFSYTLPFNHLIRIWDVYMVEVSIVVSIKNRVCQWTDASLSNILPLISCLSEISSKLYTQCLC
jgi:hypothetical protein